MKALNILTFFFFRAKEGYWIIKLHFNAQFSTRSLFTNICPSSSKSQEALKRNDTLERVEMTPLEDERKKTHKEVFQPYAIHLYTTQMRRVRPHFKIICPSFLSGAVETDIREGNEHMVESF